MKDVLQLIDEVKQVTAIVEGKKDRRALENLGFTNIVELDKPLFEVVESIPEKSTVQILTDLDPEGRVLYSKLQQDLSKRGVKIDNRLRHELFKQRISHIEGLDTFLNK